MWPKALLELLPHLTRLVPMLNRYFQSRGANEDATRIALERKLDEVATALRRDLSEAGNPSPDLLKKLRDQAEKTAALSADVQSIKESVESQGERLARMEKLQAKQQFLLLLAVLLLLILCIGFPLLLRHR